MRAPITDKHLLEMMWERYPEIMQRGTERTEQEPVAYLCEPDENGLYGLPLTEKTCTKCFPVYRHPQRTWVGLTDEERNSLWREVVGWGDPSHDDEDLMKAIEAKLKEKNT